MCGRDGVQEEVKYCSGFFPKKKGVQVFLQDASPLSKIKEN
jgi:hypothetical protein